jgi:hypothetical protein
MAVLPSKGRWPRRIPDTNQGYYYVDNRNLSAGDKSDRRGPFVCDYIPSNGQLQMPSGTARSGDPIMVVIDARIWVPLESGVKARSILTNVANNVSFTVVYAKRWPDRIEALVTRRTPS